MRPCRPARAVRLLLLAAGVGLVSLGCEVLSQRMTHWRMLDQTAMENPIAAVGGDAVVFYPGETRPLLREQLVKLPPAELVAYYAPVLIQQRVKPTTLNHPYPPEFDLIGTAQLRRDKSGTLKSSVGGDPVVYAIYQKVPINGHNHVQLTYTAWYPAHPRMKTIDLEDADIDSCVLRVTLDGQNAPIFYETIAACGFFHKVFVERWVEEAASTQFGTREKDKTYAVERTVKGEIDWEVAGLMDEPKDRPNRPVVFLKAGDHKVMGLASMARVRVPLKTDIRKYALNDYADLYSVAVDGTKERAPFFDLGKGGKVRGAERKERYIFSLVGVDAAGQPRANDQIKLHFDQGNWSDPTTYTRFLRLPPGVL